MSENNKLIIASAGSGKTTFLVNEALKNKASNVLISTYTQANEEEIRRKFIKINGCVPGNITIQTWFSFLIQHGVKPFQGSMGIPDFDFKGLLLINDQSAKYIKEQNVLQHYFSSSGKIYSDKLSKFVVKCNEKNSGYIINRLSRIYDQIFIDESQDLSGYDFEFVDLMAKSSLNLLLVADPRQCVFLTNYSQKNKKYRRNNFISYFESNDVGMEIDSKSFLINYRSCQKICELSNDIYPEYPKTISGNPEKIDHDGIFLVKKSSIEKYLLKYKAVQLRWDKKTDVSDDFAVYNIGMSKGMEFDHVLIYPTKPFVNWIKMREDLPIISKAKFYVAITRARYSVGIVWNDSDSLNDFPFWDEL